jgi:hypothetical protein
MRVAVEAAAVVDVEEGLEGGEADFLACHCRDPMSI